MIQFAKSILPSALVGESTMMQIQKNIAKVTSLITVLVSIAGNWLLIETNLSTYYIQFCYFHQKAYTLEKLEHLFSVCK